MGKTHFLRAIFLSRLQKSHRMQTHTGSKLIWTRPSRTLTEKLGTCQQTPHLAQGTTSRLTVVVTAPGSGSGSRPVISEAGFHNRVMGPPPAVRYTPCLSSPPPPTFTRCLLLRLMFHPKPDFSFLFHFVDQPSPWQPFHPPTSSQEWAHRQGLVLVLS